ncbi:MAG TPA: HAMP domain-containing sensor histidine kinase [Pseudonocardia sp.]|nr:HAMP domain-containing sensor histidine kinase [Pseudonocardia sp.]
MRSRSLRARLVALVLLLLAVAGAAITVVTTVALRGFLVDRLDDDLVAAGRRFASVAPPPGSLLLPPPSDPAVLGPGQAPGTLGAIVRDGWVQSGFVLDPAGEPAPLPAAAATDLLTLTTGAPPRTLDLAGLGEYRLVAAPGPYGDVVVIGLPEAGVDQTVAALVTTELVVTGVALLGAGTAGAILVRRELRPLERVAATATRVGALPLDRGEVELAERVPDTDPRTEVGQVGAAFNRMLDHVGAALAARHESETRLRRFVADASHELRTPLAAIRGHAELTRRDETLGPESARSLARISSSAERMSTLVEDLLLLARLDAGRPLERSAVDLTRLVLDAVEDAHVAGPGHRWRLDLPGEPVVVGGDAARLAQVVGNLLANARTHTPPGTEVVVGLAAVGDGARLSVVDSGPGIPAGLVPHVFERFARGSSSRARTDGSTGLGLAIVDAVVAAHGGTVAVESRPGRTAFTVRLPGPG